MVDNKAFSQGLWGQGSPSSKGQSLFGKSLIRDFPGPSPPNHPGQGACQGKKKGGTLSGAALAYLRVAIHITTTPTTPKGAKVRRILANPSARIIIRSIGFLGLPKGGDCSPPFSGLTTSLGVYYAERSRAYTASCGMLVCPSLASLFLERFCRAPT